MTIITEHIAKITIDGSETVKFSRQHPYYGIYGENITASFDEDFTDSDQGVYDTSATGTTIISNYGQSDTLYLKGSGTITVWAGNSPAEFPFKAQGKGGGSGGDGTHYKGTTTTALSNGSTTNPITIDGESYTAQFGDIVIYSNTEFIFDGSQWSEFGRTYDSVPTSGSSNAVISDGIYKATPLTPDAVTATGYKRRNLNGTARGNYSYSLGNGTTAQNNYEVTIGTYNGNDILTDNLFVIGNGTSNNTAYRSNILEVNRSTLNVNGSIAQNGVAMPTPYTTMPTVTADILGKIAQYVGESTNDYQKGGFYVAVSDGAQEPTYSWEALSSSSIEFDTTPTSGSSNAVTSGGLYSYIPLIAGTGANSTKRLGTDCVASGSRSIAIGYSSRATSQDMMAIGKFNSPVTGDLFEIGNGTGQSIRSNIFEVNSTTVNVNGNITKNGQPIVSYDSTTETLTIDI